MGYEHSLHHGRRKKLLCPFHCTQLKPLFKPMNTAQYQGFFVRNYLFLLHTAADIFQHSSPTPTGSSDRLTARA
jgi:hypothetical protein